MGLKQGFELLKLGEEFVQKGTDSEMCYYRDFTGTEFLTESFRTKHGIGKCATHALVYESSQTEPERNEEKEARDDGPMDTSGQPDQNTEIRIENGENEKQNENENEKQNENKN